MALVSGQFKRIAETVAKRTTELLAAAIYVTDDHGTVVASSNSASIGLPLAVLQLDEAATRVPLIVDGEQGKVIVGDPLNGEIIPPRLAEELVELVIKQTAVVDRLANQHELKNKFIHDLLRGTIEDEAQIMREAQILGMDLVPPRAVILIDASDYILGSPNARHEDPTETHIRRRSQHVIASVVGYFRLPTDTICAYIGEGEVAVLKASDSKNLNAWVDQDLTLDEASTSWANLAALKRAAGGLLMRLRRDTGGATSMGVGRYHPGVRGLARSYQDARAALSIGRRLHGQNGVHCLDGLGIAAFVAVADERTKTDLATYLLSPLDQEPELLETLDAFFDEHCRPSSTASRLWIHRNTLSYRLEKITALTGLDPRRFDDAVQIRLALMLRSLQRGATELCNCTTTPPRERKFVGQMPDALLPQAS